ncbi:MAG: ATP-dependent DNA helicase [Candidatus Acidiferrales bacterium]
MKNKPNANGLPGLNAEQRAAVEHGDGPLLVVAGAGTGKTRVIIERIRNLLENDPELAGENILALTFTDKAAGQMKHRVVKAIGERAEGVCLGTFHSFCLEQVLRPANPDIQPLDDIDHKILLRRHIGELELKHFRRLQDPGEFISDFVTFFSRCQDELVTPDDYQRYVTGLRRKHEVQKKFLESDALQIAEEAIARQEELARVYRVSERLLRERNLLTFGAQLMHTVALLRDDTVLRNRVQEQYRYILVDEFQDTNIAQLELLWLLAGERRNIVAVGDDDQAIYRFRGASFGSFTIFLKRFCGVSDAKMGPAAHKFLVSLSQNYRSTERILRVAGEVIAHNEKSPLLPPKRLITENREGEKIRIAEFGMPEEEAYWVTSEIERMHAAGARWRSFAVLYRKHNHREKLVNALRGREIPFVIRRLSILESTLVRDLFAWLRLIEKPADNVACARVLAAPYWGLEPRDLVRLAERASKNRRRLLADEVESAQNQAPFDRPGVKLEELVELLSRLRHIARRHAATEVVDQLIAGLRVAPLSSDQDRYYLDRFVKFVLDWEGKSEKKQLRDFIEYLDYFHEACGDICLEEEQSDDAVQLMTVHAAKGLEFPHVFILRLSRNDFPSGQRKVVFEFPPEMMKEEKPKGDFQIQEERRLFYVALTRARQQLTLSTLVNQRKRPSLFLDDFLMNTKIKKLDTHQLAPQLQVPAELETTGPEPDSAEPAQLFPAGSEPTRAYSRVAPWAKVFHPPRPEPLQLSVSAIDKYDRCPMRYMFQYVWSIRGGPHAMATFGNVMHTTIKEFVGDVAEQRKVSLEDLCAIYDREWSAAGYIDDYHAEEYRKAGRDQLKDFYQKYTAVPVNLLCQEKTFELSLDHDVIVTGRMDQVNRIAGDKVEIIDYKTGKPKDDKAAAKDLQLSVYALAAREVLELDPVRLVFYNLMTNEAVATARDAKALDETKKKIAEVADLIRAGEFPAKPGYGCGFCDYKPICPAHEQLISIQVRRNASEPKVNSGTLFPL